MPSQTAAAKDLKHAHSHEHHFWPLTLGALGVVYGDIGTSLIYAFKEAVTAAAGLHGTAVTTVDASVIAPAVLGILSLIIWTLLLLVTGKYVFLVLRADLNGEGGTFALMSLAQRVAGRSKQVMLILGIVGTCFLYGDAAITPALSVISAIEGMNVISPTFGKFVLPLSIVILVMLFAVQSYGTARMAAYFGPIIVVWFLALGGMGIVWILKEPGVLVAFNPYYGVAFFANHGMIGMTALGLVFLAVTGAEALYADMGHFGRKPIQAAWLAVVLPALTLNYLGQGAAVLSNPEAIENPFFLMYPPWALWPMVLLSTVATVIASQAVITGAYSVTRQAIQLGLLPRFSVLHTSKDVAGQIYLPRVNWVLLVVVLLLVVIFKSSSALTAAYGIAVTATMITTSIMAFFVAWRLWGWSLWQSAGLFVPLLALEMVFFSANIMKIFEGAWVPLVIAGSLVIVMLTWARGTSVLNTQSRRQDTSLAWLVGKLEQKPPHRVNGTAVFLTATPNAAPSALLHNLKHNHMLHERNIIITIRTAEVPRVPSSEVVKIEKISDSFIGVTLTYGFMETPSVERGLQLCRKKGLNIDSASTSFFLSRRVLRPASKSKMPFWQDQLFIWLAGSAEDATNYFQIPADRVVEIGTQINV
jgi:KUP system potassium uptake protein